MAFPDTTSELTHILVVKDTAASKDFYVDKLGSEPFGDYGSSVVIKFLGNWLLLVEPGTPEWLEAEHIVDTIIAQRPHLTHD